MDRLRRADPKQQGQSLMEFALVLPILLMMFMGIIDLGRFMFLYSQTINAAREGARYGSVVGLNTTSIPQYIECDDIRTAARSAFGLAVQPDDMSIAIEYDHGTGSVFAECVSATNRPTARSISIGDRVLITFTTTYSFLTPVMTNIMGPVELSFTSARTILVGGTVVGPPNP